MEEKHPLHVVLESLIEGHSECDTAQDHAIVSVKAIKVFLTALSGTSDYTVDEAVSDLRSFLETQTNGN